MEVKAPGSIIQQNTWMIYNIAGIGQKVRFSSKLTTYEGMWFLFFCVAENHISALSSSFSVSDMYLLLPDDLKISNPRKSPLSLHIFPWKSMPYSAWATVDSNSFLLIEMMWCLGWTDWWEQLATWWIYHLPALLVWNSAHIYCITEKFPKVGCLDKLWLNFHLNKYLLDSSISQLGCRGPAERL